MKLGRPIAIAALAALASLAAPPAQQANAAPPPRSGNSLGTNWNGVIAVTRQGGYLVGNPNAAVKLIEYVSYTCPHCAEFEKEADTTLRMAFIANGKGSIEYRSLLRNKIDVAVTLLVTCGSVSKFRGNHTAMLRGQERWFHGPSQGEQQRWSSPDFATSMRAIANDLKLYDVMANRGYTRPQLDRCLMNREAANKLAAQTQFAVEELKVQGTPSFILNGQLQEAHDWAALRPRLMELTR
jgi:protein-disulfide isomerase